jgi:hypothetical protein
MTRRTRLLANAGAAALLLGLAAPATAAPITEALFFAATNQNPFQAGPAVSWDRTWSTRDFPIARTEVPALRFPPSGPVYLEAGGRTEGQLGLNLNAQFSSGTLDMAYPVRAVFDAPAPDTVRAGSRFSLGFSSQAPATGLFRLSDVINTTRVIDLGNGVRIQGGSGGTERVSPFIRTTFPSLAAQLELEYTQVNSAFVQGCVDAFIARACGDIGSIRLPSLGPVTQTIASLGREGAYVLPGTSFEAGIDFGKAYPLLTGIDGSELVTVTPFYPTLATQGGMDGTNGPLRAEGSQPILRFQGDLDGIIDNYVLRPALLPTLQGNIGPGQYTLLDATATLDATVYQEFEYTPELRVRLDFDQAMTLPGSRPFTQLDMRVGETVELRSVFGVAGDVTVRPTYYLGGRMHSETGLGIGAGIDAAALRFQILGLDTGFAWQDDFYEDAPLVGIYETRFTPVLRDAARPGAEAGIVGAPFTLNFADALITPSISRITLDPAGRALAEVNVSDGANFLAPQLATGHLYGTDGRRVLDVTDTRVLYEGGNPRFYEDITQPLVFVADEDLLVDLDDDDQLPPINLGTAVCFKCFAVALPEAEDPTLLTLLDGTVVRANNDVAAMDLVSPGPADAGGTSLTVPDAGGFTAFTPDDVPPQFAWLFDRTPVPEPSAALLLLAGLGMLGAVRRRAG